MCMLLGLCKAFRCHPRVDRTSFTLKISSLSDPNAMTVMSGLPTMNSSGICFILQDGTRKSA
jgi:hypothetical protein